MGVGLTEAFWGAEGKADGACLRSLLMTGLDDFLEAPAVLHGLTAADWPSLPRSEDLEVSPRGVMQSVVADGPLALLLVTWCGVLLSLQQHVPACNHDSH